MENTNIGKELKRIRIKMGLTQTEVAKLMQVRRETIGTWERGYNTPNPICESKLQGLLDDWGKLIGMSDKL